MSMPNYMLFWVEHEKKNLKARALQAAYNHTSSRENWRRQISDSKSQK